MTLSSLFSTSWVLVGLWVLLPGRGVATAGAPGPIPPDALVIPVARASLATAPIELAGPWHQAPGDLTRDQALGGRTTAPPWQVLDDTAWAPRTRLPRWSGVGWFRLELEVDPDLVGHPLALAVEHPGASEIFLDGEALTRFGSVAGETEEERPYDPRGEPVPIVFSTPEKERRAAPRITGTTSPFPPPTATPMS